MKVETYCTKIELEVPLEIENEYKKWLGNNLTTEEAEKDLEWGFFSFFDEYAEKYFGKIIGSKEVVEFIATYFSEYGDSGYNIFDYMKFEDNGIKYTIFYCGPHDAHEENYGRFIGYKEE